MAGGESLRIAHVVASNKFAGVERSITLTAKALDALGHEVIVVGGERDTMLFHLDGRNVRWIPASGPVDVLMALSRLGRLDVVHAHMTNAELAAITATPWTRAPLFVTRHFAIRRGMGRIGGVARLLIESWPHTEISISNFVAERVSCDSTVIYHGLDDNEQVALAEKRVVVIQRLEREKETEVAIEAWQLSGLGDAGWELAIAGEGADRARLEHMARTLGVDRSITFLGQVADVTALRARASLQLATPPGEHFGLSVLEAMACGLPVVAADGGAHREILGGEGDFLFTPSSAASCSASLQAAVAERSSLRREASRLRERQRAHFSLEAHGKQLSDLYRARLSPAVGGPPPH